MICAGLYRYNAAERTGTSYYDEYSFNHRGNDRDYKNQSG
jgi:hypothetical protein